MSELTMNQLRLNESEQPEYPRLRLPAALKEWGSQMALVLSKSGCASATQLYATDLMALPDGQRIICEKVYGTLLSPKGPLRNQPSLCRQLTELMDASPNMWMHGGRLWLAMVSGLPFLPVAIVYPLDFHNREL